MGFQVMTVINSCITLTRQAQRLPGSSELLFLSNPAKVALSLMLLLFYFIIQRKFGAPGIL